MLTRSVVAVLCGALTVAALPGVAELNPVQQIAELFEDYAFQETFDEPQWLDDALDDSVAINVDDHPKHPPIPHLPHHGGHGEEPSVENKTIYQALKEDTRFSRVFKLVNYTEEITDLLNDTKGSLTFFAVPDKALQPPKKHHKHSNLGFNFDDTTIDPLFNSLAAALADTTDERELFSVVESFVDYDLLDNDSDDKERKKKIIKAIVTAVLKYHILPGKLSADTLATNNTYSTGLKLPEGSLDGESFRVRISSEPRLIHRKVKVNFYASVIYSDVKTENGLVHVLDHPLFPPPSIFTILFAFSDVFSTLTSAIQRVNGTDAVDWHWVRDTKTLEGSPAVTVFAPTNEAFHVLPRRLKFFLFSPFGHRALKKILAYHVVPEYIFHTNWHHNASDSLAVTTYPTLEDDSFSYLRSEYLHNVEVPMEDEEDVNAAITGVARPRGCGHRASSSSSLRSLRQAMSTIGVPQPYLIRGAHAFAASPFVGSPATAPPPPHHAPPHLPTKPVFTYNATLPSALTNHTLHVHVAQFKSVLPKGGYITKVFVNGLWVAVPDVPSRNGAIHVVKRLIRPFRKGHHGHKVSEREESEAWFQMAMMNENERDNDWDDWEDWLPQWANED